MGPVPGTSLVCRTDDQVAQIVAVNGTHRLPDALDPLIKMCGAGPNAISMVHVAPPTRPPGAPQLEVKVLISSLLYD